MPYHDKPKEKCGVFGFFSRKGSFDLKGIAMSGLSSLQHRGQDSCGFTVYHETLKNLTYRGLVADLFSGNVGDFSFRGSSFIGHVRYATSGDTSQELSQPILCSKNKISICHNGNVFYPQGALNDSYFLLELLKGSDDIPTIIQKRFRDVTGSYSLLILTEDSLYAMRDPRGYRPLCLGESESGYMIASESCSFNSCNGKFIREILPGELLQITSSGIRSWFPLAEAEESLCAFEYIYFSREDSLIGGKNIYDVRYDFGKTLGERLKGLEADCVLGVPDSGLPSSLGFSQATGIPLSLGLMKDRYAARTFIHKKKEEIPSLLAHKFVINPNSVKGKKVILVDDSLVRGNTMRKLCSLLRDNGAQEIHVCITSPPIVNTCNLGIAITSTGELLCSSSTTEEVCDYIQCDRISFLTLDEMLNSVGHNNLCTRCFSK